MILFKRDWQEYPSAIPDYKTKNKTFLDYATLLDDMGVANSAFCLSLFNRELQGVDPYSETLSTVQMRMIAQECRWNPWYFFREVFRVPPIAGINPVQFRANRANMSMIWSFLNHIDYLLIQPRQTGKSVSTDALSTWLYLFALRNSKMLLITKDDTLRSDNVIRLRNMRGYLPKWLVLDDRTDANNTTMVTYNTRGNIYRTAVGQNSEDGALKVGRGGTVPFMHIDEGPFIPYADIMIPAATSAMNAAKDEAAGNGLPYGLVMTTTAGKIDSRSGKYFYDEIYRRSAGWTELFFDAENEEQLKKMIRANSRERILKIPGVDAEREVGVLTINGTFNHRQLGYDDLWLYRKMAESRSTGDAADRDYMNIWTAGGVSSPFSNNITSAIMHSERDPNWREIGEDGYILNWYKPQEDFEKYMANTHLAIGIDTSDAIGRDGIAIVFTDQQDLSVAAVANINETNLIKAARWVGQLLIKYQNTTMIVEKRSSGQTFIDTAIMMLHAAGIDPTKRIYSRLVDERSTRTADWKLMRDVPSARRNERFYDKWRKDFGFNTTGASRDLLYSQVLLNATKHSASLVCNRTLSEELRRLEIKNGRLDHSSGGHDDTVIAWLLTHWFFMYGRNLDHYGIDPRKIMLKVGRDGQVATVEEVAERERQETIRLEVESLTDQLKNMQDPYLVVITETRLNKLLGDLGQTEDALSLDAMVKKAKEDRRKRINNNRKRYANERSYSRAA